MWRVFTYGQGIYRWTYPVKSGLSAAIYDLNFTSADHPEPGQASGERAQAPLTAYIAPSLPHAYPFPGRERLGKTLCAQGPGGPNDLQYII